MQRYYIFISLVKDFVTEKLFTVFVGRCKSTKNYNKLIHYFEVILLNDVIWAFGPKVTCRVTYVKKNISKCQKPMSCTSILSNIDDKIYKYAFTFLFSQEEQDIDYYKNNHSLITTFLRFIVCLTNRIFPYSIFNFYTAKSQYWLHKTSTSHEHWQF